VELRIAEITFEIITKLVYNTYGYVEKAHPSSSCKLVVVGATSIFYRVLRG